MIPTTSKPRPTIVLAALDTAPQADDVLRTAGLLAQMLGHAELHLLRVVEPPTPPLDAVAATFVVGPAVDELVKEAREDLSSLVKDAAAHFAGPTTTHVAVGVPGQEIVALAERLEADVVVVGCQGKEGMRRVLLGSVSEYVTRHAPCSVLVARPRHEEADGVIEPVCPDCAAARARSRGEHMWCERHLGHHAHASLHYESPPTFGVGSMLIRPEG